MKRFTCTLLAISTLITVSASGVLAGNHNNGNNDNGSNDTGNVQNNVQTGIITGDDNATLQKNKQINEMGRRRGNDVNVQDNDQLCDVAGFGNACAQKSRQESRVRNRHDRDHGRDRRSYHGDDD